MINVQGLGRYQGNINYSYQGQSGLYKSNGHSLQYRVPMFI